MSDAATSRIVLDHIAIAVPDIDEALDVLRSNLGAQIISGDQVPGYRFVQTRVGTASSGMTLELLEPWQVEADDYLDRFLRRHGAGPHHITFLQPDARATLDTLREEGYPLVRTRLDFSPWQESFIHPSHGCGTVIQVAGSSVPSPQMAELLTASQEGRRPPEVPYDERSQDGFWWSERHPPYLHPAPASLEKIVVNVAELRIVRELFLDVLDGTVVAEDSSALEVRWGDTGCIRFVRSDSASVEELQLTGLNKEFELGAARFRRLPASDVSCSTD